MIYIIDTKDAIFWSRRKMDRDFKHACEFLYRDKARAKELTQKAFNRLKQSTPKKVIEIVEEADG